MKKQEPSLQVKFSTNCGGDTRHRRVQWLSSPSQSLTGLFWWLSWQQAWRWWVCHLAKVLQCAYDESQGLLEAEPLAIFHRCGSDQFLFFFFFFLFAASSWNLFKSKRFPFKGEAELWFWGNGLSDRSSWQGGSQFLIFCSDWNVTTIWGLTSTCIWLPFGICFLFYQYYMCEGACVCIWVCGSRDCKHKKHQASQG